MNNPEIEEKLLNLQSRHERQMKGNQRNTSEALMNNHHEYSSPAKRKHSLGRNIDDDWVLDTPKRRPPRSQTYSDKKNVAVRSISNADPARNSPVDAPKVTTASRSSSASKAPTSTQPALRKPQQDHVQMTNKSKTPHKPKAESPAKTPIKPPGKTPIKSPAKGLATASMRGTSPVGSKTTTATESVAPKSMINVNGAASSDEKPVATYAKRETDKKKQLQVMNSK